MDESNGQDQKPNILVVFGPDATLARCEIQANQMQLWAFAQWLIARANMIDAQQMADAMKQANAGVIQVARSFPAGLKVDN